MKSLFLFAILAISMNAFAQVSKTVNCTAGSLSTLLTANEKSTVTNLTITGTTDARDFKTMRDDLPLLADLDLSTVNILAYNGSDGTSPWGKTGYSADVIPESAFMQANWLGKNSLIVVKLPESIISIEQNAFYSCKGLTGITFPASCISIGDDSFSNCSGFTIITIPGSLISIGKRAFMGCSGLFNVAAENPKYSDLEGVLFDKNKSSLIQFPSSKTGSYSVPESVSTISEYAFYRHTGLTSVNFSPSVNSIGDNAFAYCSGLISANIPQSLNYIGIRAFYNCTGLDGTLNIPNSVNSIENEAFSFCTSVDVVNIPASVAKIGDYAFYNCGAIFKVDNGNPVYSSEDGILFNKTKTILIQCGSSRVESYKIPDSVVEIGKSAFSRCRSLTGVTIPKTVSIIGMNAFWGCTSLTGPVVIPAAVKTIGNYAFSGCTSLNSIYSYSPVPVDLYTSIDVFFNVNKSTCILYVPKGSKSDYQSAYQWYEFQNIVEMPGFTFSTNSVIIEREHGSKATVDISSDVAWQAKSDQSWLSVSPASGIGNSKTTFTASENTTNSIRTAKVTVSAVGVEPQIITVVQAYNLQSNITKLYDFEFQYPYSLLYRSNLVNDGTYLYGLMTDVLYEKSVLIKIKPDGTGFQELYSIEDNTYSDIITISEDEIYGKIDARSIFKIKTDGSNYTEIDLSDEIDSEEYIGSFVVSGNSLYGTIERIVADGLGTRIFKINTDGTGFSTVYSSDGINDLSISANTLISFKDEGFLYRKMFRINPDGSGYSDYGINSVVKIITQESVIYGEAYNNTGDEWNIFKVNIDGSGYTILKSFSNSESYPFHSLSISGTTLYGMSENNEIFRINLDGTDFKQIQIDLNNQDVWCEPTLIGEKICGLASENWINSFLYQINISNYEFSKVFKFGTSSSGMLPECALIESGNFLYGSTYGGGSYGMGTIFRINKDGNNYTKLFEFQNPETGTFPVGQLTRIGNQLFGTTSGGWDQTDHGGIFKINLDGSDYSIMHKFDMTNGAYPNGSLVLHKGSLYGITNDGGIESHGVVFKINPDGSGFSIVSQNTDIDTGENPSNGIIISDDDVIYGVTTVDYGSVFRVNTDGTGLSKIFEMNNESGDFSYCKPLLINDELYITTSEGGANGVGTIFRIKTDGSGFTVLHNFEGQEDNGSDFGNNSLLFHDGALFGTATSDGINDHGYLFRINLDGTGFTKLSDFNGEYGSMPYLCDLIIDDNEEIFGMTTLGGKYSGGIIYKYPLKNTSAEKYFIKEETIVKVFPNPAKSGFRLEGINEKASIWLTNTTGQLIFSKEIENGEYISIESIPSGLYILRINSGENKIVKKIVKM